MTEAAARSLRVDRVAVWLFDDERTKIVCHDLFEASLGRHTSGDELRRDDFPSYFAALLEERSLAIDDAQNDPRTRALAEPYLVPLQIGALLDAPIFTEGHCIGVVCHEHVGGPRTWWQEEKSFTASIADFAALAIEADHRRRAEEARRDSETQLRVALEAARMGTWSWDLQTNVVEWSANAAPFLGLQARHAMPLSELVPRIHPDDRPALERISAEAIEQRTRDWFAEYRITPPEGGLRWIESRGQVQTDDSGKPVRVVGTTADITDRKRFEEELRESQRLEGLGRLAGGIAHDFNNLLTVMRCSVRGLRREPQPSARKLAQLDHLEEAVQRAGELVSQLLAFAREQPRRRQRVEIDAFVTGIVGLLRRLLGEQIETVLDLGGEGLAVDVDPSQLEQVVINLALNARDAMGSGGRLTIRTRRNDKVPELPVCLEIEDTGSGIPASVLPHIFEPFFTTKDFGKGTGLGLSTCYGIVRQAGGDIEVDTEVGTGTTFIVRLPAATGAAAEGPAEPAGELVLLIEDEPLVRDIAESILSESGFRVVTADRGEAGVEMAQRLDEPIAAIVADMVLPGLKGAQLIEALRTLSPDAPVLFISGYTQETGPWLSLERSRFLAKPFTPEQLVAEVRAMLAERAGS